MKNPESVASIVEEPSAKGREKQEKPNEPIRLEKKPARLEKAELQRDFLLKLENEIVGYRFNDEIAAQIEKFAGEFSARANKSASENKGETHKLPSFDKGFQERYLVYRLSLSRITKQVKEFLAAPRGDKVENLVAEIIKEETFAGKKDEIRAWLLDYCSQAEQVAAFYEGNSWDELFKKITDKKPAGYAEYKRKGNALVINAYSDEDYVTLFKGKRDRALLSGGFYCHDVKIKLDKKSGRKHDEKSGKKSEILFPIIVVRSNPADIMEGGEFGDAYNDEYWSDYLPEAYEEYSGKSARDDESGDFTEAYLKWQSKVPHGYSFEAYVLDKIQRGNIWGDFDSGFESKVGDWQTELKATEAHEEQHHQYDHIFFEVDDVRRELSDKGKVADYFKDILKKYLRRLGDEIIATAKSTLIWRQREESTDTIGLIRSAMVDGESVSEDEKEYVEDFEKGPQIDLCDALYFYPNGERRAIYKELTDALGKEKMKEWQIEALWRETVVEPFRKKKKQLEMIGTFFTKLASDQRESKDEQKIIDLFEIEPIESWPRLYYWFRNDPSLARKIGREK